jgi:N-methylhydantoinase A
MEVQAAKTLAAEGFAPEQQLLTRTIDVRYSGQEHSVTVGFPADAADPRESIREEFQRLHERQYGHVMDDPIETTTMRLNAVGTVDKPSLPQVPVRTEGAPTELGRRAVYLDGRNAAEYVLYARESLLASDTIQGPAIITEHTATTVMHKGDTLSVGAYGELVISIRNDNKEATPNG